MKVLLIKFILIEKYGYLLRLNLEAKATIILLIDFSLTFNWLHVSLSDSWQDIVMLGNDLEFYPFQKRSPLQTQQRIPLS